MAQAHVSRRSRSWKILRLFFGLLFSFYRQYLFARIRGRRPDPFADPKLNRARAIRIRESALEMGGVLIKVGQFLSSRVDLLPAEYIEELSQLQDEVPAVRFEEIVPLVERELAMPLDKAFAQFDREAVAAASLGQVHAALLPTGQRVAVKVQRPNIDAFVAADLGALQYIVNWLNRRAAIRRRVDLPQVFREFEATLYMELDYIQEAHHAERFAVLFAPMEAIEIPRVYWSHTRKRVLTLEFMSGIKVTDFKRLEDAHISRAQVARLIMQAYLAQVLEFGFFHADPHPGNIFVRPGPVVVLVDFGMVGELAPDTESNLRRVFFGFIRRDYDEVLSGLTRLGFVTRRADTYALKRALAWMVDNFYDMSFGELRAIDPTEVLDELHDVLFAEYIRVPASYAFLGRALGSLTGLCTSLDPTFQFVTVAEPFAREIVRARRGVAELARQVTSGVVSLARTTYTLPYLAQGTLSRVDAGEFDFQRQIDSLETVAWSIERLIRQIVYAIVVSALVLVGAFLYARHTDLIALGAVVIAAVLTIAAIFPLGRRR